MGKIVVLANSKKHGGYCMAGKTLDSVGEIGGWLRPVYDCGAGSLPMSRTLCTDGLQASVLDVVEQDWGVAAPTMHQRENRLLGQSTLQRCGRADWDDLAILADDVSSGLWLDGHSTSCGMNDRVPFSILPYLTGSLQLVAANDLVIFKRLGYENQVKYRAKFSVNNRRYDIALTDTVATAWLMDTTRLSFETAYVCVSLAVPHTDGFAYKLAAAIITKERAENSR
jgi:hypothetical protein